MDDMLRVPQCVEAEQSVIGALMLDNDSWNVVAEILTAEDFYRRDHQELFKALRDLSDARRPMDVLTVSEFLQASDRLESAGGLAYLATIAKNTPSAANIRAYAEIVKERSLFRQVMMAGSEISTLASNHRGMTAKEVLDLAQQAVFKIEHKPAESGFKLIKDSLREAIDRIDIRFMSTEPTGILTGFVDLDKTLISLEGGSLIYLAARPSVGKTSLAMNIAVNVAEHGKRVAVFSLEMPTAQLTERLISSMARIPYDRVRTGKMEDEDWGKLAAAVSRIHESRLAIDDTAQITPTELRAKCRRLALQWGSLDLVVVDYLQLMRSGNRFENRNLEVSYMSASLKAAAKELNCPVLCLSQLNRDVEKTGRRPALHDLRDSGSIEQDADMVWFIHAEGDASDKAVESPVVSILVEKNRNGKCGAVPMVFDKRTLTFQNFAHGGGQWPS